MTTNPFQKATRAQLKARVALEGPTGAGKTWTALEWATVLAAGAPIAVVDTERGSASLYSDRFGFDVLTFEPPYEPQRLTDILKAAEAHGYAVVVIDSLSHFWEGEGGTLDMVDAAASRSGGNQFAGWKVGTPALRHLVDTMLGVGAHVIATMRSKMEYVLSENERGKKVPQKVGMAPVMRAGVEYEFTLVGDLDLEHRLTITKSRCDLLADQVVQPGRAGEAAEQFMGWLGQGEPLAARADVDALVARMNAIGDDLRRKACKRAFRDEIGMPTSVRESQMVAAAALVARFEAGGGDGDGPSGSAAAAPPPGSSGGGGAAVPAPSAAAAPGVPDEPEFDVDGDGQGPPAQDVTGGEGSPHESDGAGDVPGPAPAPSGGHTLTQLDQALLAAAGRPTIPASKTVVLRAAAGHGHTGTYDELLVDEAMALAVLADLGGTLPTDTDTDTDPSPVDLTPWKQLDEKAWDTWRKRCNAMAGPGTKTKPHPRILDEDKSIYDEQRHALAYGASRKVRGEGCEVTSWGDLTGQECRMISRTLEMLGEGYGILTFGDTGSPGGWVVQSKAEVAA